MAMKQDILLTPASGYQHIDALLAAGPDWNYLTSNGSDFRTTLYYSFAVDGPRYEAGVQVFNTAQQQAARQVLSYVASVTGISFAEAATSTAADLHFAVAQVANPEFGGICYAGYQYTADATGRLTSYSANAFIYLDSVRTSNPTPVAGSWWYQALLHEIGHALGLKHPFEATADMPTTLQPPYQDTTSFSIMSYTHTSAAYYSQFNEYDLAALNYLYGGDGLRGDWGMGTSGLYLTGSTMDDLLYAPAGKAVVVDPGGNDTISYRGALEDYRIIPSLDKTWLHVIGTDTDHLISSSIENLSFSDSTVLVRGFFTPIEQEAVPIYAVEGVVFGTDTADILIGTSGNDVYCGFAGDDTFVVTGGDDLLFGGMGLDTVQFDVARHEAVVTNKSGAWSVNSHKGVAALHAIERLEFTDSKVALDLHASQSAGQAALVAAAAGGAERLGDLVFLGELIELFDSGETIQQVCRDITDADWFHVATDGTDAGFVNLVYQHIIGTAPTAAEQGSLLGMLAGYGGSMSQADLLAVAALTQVNQNSVDLVGLQQTGLVFV